MALEQASGIIKNLNEIEKLDEKLYEFKNLDKIIAKNQEKLVTKNKDYLNDLLTKAEYKEDHPKLEKNLFYSRKKGDGSIDLVVINNLDSQKMNLVYTNTKENKIKDFIKKKVFLDNSEKYIPSGNNLLEGVLELGLLMGLAYPCFYCANLEPPSLSFIGTIGSLAAMFGVGFCLPGFFESKRQSKVNKVSHDFEKKYKPINGTKNVLYSDAFKPLTI